MTEYEKPRKFRNRKKDKSKYKEDELHSHPVHRPYQREHVNWRRSLTEETDATIDSGTDEEVSSSDQNPTGE